MLGGVPHDFTIPLHPPIWEERQSALVHLLCRRSLYASGVVYLFSVADQKWSTIIRTAYRWDIKRYMGVV